MLSEKMAYRLAQHRVATNLQFVKKQLSATSKKVKHDKTRYAYKEYFPPNPLLCGIFQKTRFFATLPFATLAQVLC